MIQFSIIPTDSNPYRLGLHGILYDIINVNVPYRSPYGIVDVLFGGEKYSLRQSSANRFSSFSALASALTCGFLAHFFKFMMVQGYKSLQVLCGS